MINEIMLVAAVILLSAVLFNKAGAKIGLPSLLVFILLGILAGSDGLGGIKFEDYKLAQFIGIIAISYILFMGGLSVDIDELRPVFYEGIVLATFGVLITGLIAGCCAYFFMDLPFLECLLLGGIISSTDAAAVFSVLRSRNISLKDSLKPLLEFESGSNDPMAVFLTLGIIGLITAQLDIPQLVIMFFMQMFIGIILGYFFAKLIVLIINKIRLEYDSLYVVITIAGVLLTYSFISIAGGNGFIGVYVCGLVMSGLNFVNKNSLIKFHDAVAWLMQIIMFVILGLLVNFKSGFVYTKQAFLLAMVLIFFARPIAVFICSSFFKRSLNEKLMISWVGLRGAAPIVLATFPLTAAIPHSMEIFNIVFFVVIISVLLQGTTIPYAAKLLNVASRFSKNHSSILEFNAANTNNKMIEFTVPENSYAVGKQLYEINLPAKSVVGLIYKNGEYIIPTGTTLVEACDVLFVLLDVEAEADVRRKLCTEKDDESIN